MDLNKRFADTGVALYELKTHFVVQCPLCQGKSLVARLADTHRLTCSKCFHVEQTGRWYGTKTAYVAVKCRDCHEPIRRSATIEGQWEKLATRCDNCGDMCEYDAHITHETMHNGQVTDPIFGLPLWLQITWRNELFWAYHYEHLTILREYIAAKHRERGIEPRNTIKKNSAMLSRLPSFMTKASNRTEMLRVIDILEKKC